MVDLATNEKNYEREKKINPYILSISNDPFYFNIISVFGNKLRDFMINAMYIYKLT